MVIECVLEIFGSGIELNHVGAVEREVPAELTDLVFSFRELDGEACALVAILGNQQDPLISAVCTIVAVVIAFVGLKSDTACHRDRNQHEPHVLSLGCGLTEKAKLSEIRGKVKRKAVGVTYFPSYFVTIENKMRRC